MTETHVKTLDEFGNLFVPEPAHIYFYWYCHGLDLLDAYWALIMDQGLF